jgi:hypothetical protein
MVDSAYAHTAQGGLGDGPAMVGSGAWEDFTGSYRRHVGKKVAHELHEPDSKFSKGREVAKKSIKAVKQHIQPVLNAVGKSDSKYASYARGASKAVGHADKAAEAADVLSEFGKQLAPKMHGGGRRLTTGGARRLTTGGNMHESVRKLAPKAASMSASRRAAYARVLRGMGFM